MRNKFYTHLFLFLLPVLAGVLIFSCGKDHALDVKKYGNCSNKEQDQNETGVDCGGVCRPCANCNDGIKNQGEEGVDCGGPCPSCSPACTVTAASVNYTLYLTQTAVLDYTAAVYSLSYLKSSFTTEMSISVSNSTLKSMQIRFMDGLDIFDIIPLNETMAFQTVTSTQDIYSNNQVYFRYSYEYGFSPTYGSIKEGQAIYITRVADKKARLRFCGLKGSATTYGDDLFEINAEN